LSVPPPRTIASLTACIARIEGFVVRDTPLIEEIQIFKDVASEDPMRTDVTAKFISIGHNFKFTYIGGL
jgi:hypothetical protein